MAGRSSRYGVEPAGEYFIGLLSGRHGMRARRGREQYVVRPGDVVVWDPSAPHSGRPLDGRPWQSQLMVVELADMNAIVGDTLMRDLAFPNPVVRDGRLARHFVGLQRALRSGDQLEREVELVEFLDDLASHSPASRHQTTEPADEPALRRACDYLGDNLTRNVSLDELAEAAGVDKFRLTRLFRRQLGLPPHQLQLAQRVKLARRLLERGATIVEAGHEAGFADQSHLHRHFRRRLGLTPRQYVARHKKAAASSSLPFAA